MVLQMRRRAIRWPALLMSPHPPRMRPASTTSKAQQLRRTRTRYGQDITTCKAEPPVEVLDAQLQPLQALRSSACVLPQVRAPPHLPSPHRARGSASARQEVDVVGASPDDAASPPRPSPRSALK